MMDSIGETVGRNKRRVECLSWVSILGLPSLPAGGSCTLLTCPVVLPCPEFHVRLVVILSVIVFFGWK